MNSNITVAFDVDGTLINLDDTPRYEVIAVFKAFQALGCHMVVWSGGGYDYADRWNLKLGLKATIARKGQFTADIAFDDFPSDDMTNELIKNTLGKTLIKV